MFNSFNKENAIPSFAAQEKWTKDFLSDFIIKSVSDYKKIKDFFKTDCSESSFKKIFPNYQYKKYIHPVEYGSMPNSEELNKMSEKLSQLLGSNKKDCFSALNDLYHFRSSYWNYDKFLFLLGNYDYQAYLNNRYKKVS